VSLNFIGIFLRFVFTSSARPGIFASKNTF